MTKARLKKGPIKKYPPKKVPQTTESHLNKEPLKQYPPTKVSQTIKEENKKSYFDLIGLAIIILLGIIIYSNSFNCTFQLDDSYTIVDNLKIRNLSNVEAWWNFSPNRPVAFFTFALNYHFHQLDVRYWHLFNLVIHLFNACLVWWLTLLIYSSPALKDLQIAKHKKVLAFVTALLFVSHPLATQSVTYIVQRMTSMVAMFYLISLALYVKARLINMGNLFKYLLFAGSIISAVLAMLTKENAFTLPFAILLFEFFFIRTKKLSVNFKDYRVILLIAAFLVVILIIPLKYPVSIFKPFSPISHPEFVLTPFNYLLTQFSVIVKYIQLLILPVNQNVDYNFPISNSFFEIRTLLSFLVLISLIILAKFFYKKQRVVSFGIFWFFLTLSIESSIIPINDVIFEHRTYLPSFGFFIILSSATAVLFLNKYKTLLIGIWALIVISNSILTFERNKVWKDELSLWNDAVIKSPNKARPLTSRGTAYSKIGQWNKAIADYTRALQIDPKYQLALTDRGFAYRNLGQYDKAIADYTRAIEIDPMYALTWSNRGYILFKRGEWQKAIDDFNKAIEINPEFVDAYSNRSAAYSSIGQYDKAIADITKAIELNPDYSVAYSNRGAIYGILKQHDKAIADLSRAIELNPKYVEAYTNRGGSYAELEQWDKALADISTAIGINPDFRDSYSVRGGIFLKLGQWDKSIADYTHAIYLDPNYALGYYNRGLAYSNLGQIEKTIADYSSAIKIAPRYIQAYVNRGNAYGKLGQWDKALDDFSSALRIDPNFTIAINNREIAVRNLRGAERK